MTVADARYDEGYWERGEGSNYVEYGDDPGWPATAALLAGVRSGPRLLEVGAAKGWFVKHARSAGFDAHGIDVSQWALDHLADGLDKHAVTLGSAVNFAARGRSWWGGQPPSFDTVCSWEVLEHIDKEDVPDALSSMWSMLLPGGLFVHRICLPDAMHDVDHTHVTVVPREWWLMQMVTVAPEARRLPWVERMFDQQFAGRDWAGRYFAYRKP